ncbi:MAG: tripartite tricarboxylate transporter substrate-binding protein, partial [Betaproteobacteria bacterium]
KLNFGSAGNGSATHMNAEKFRAAAGFDALHIPFKGTPEALSEVMAGRLDFFFAPIVSALQLIKEGKVTALAVGTARRAALLPNVPSTVELGYPGSDFNFWVGLFAPAKTPREIVNRMNQEVTRALQSSEIRDRYAILGAEPFSMKPEEFDAYVASEIELNGRIVKAAGIKAN